MQNDDILEYLMKKAFIDTNSCQVNDIKVLKLFLWEVENVQKEVRWN
jgi:hypothetical protein